jgi:ketosteroid isomerase-like protein
MTRARSVAQRLVEAFGTGSEPLLDEIYAEDVVLYSPVARVDGRHGVKDFIAELHRGFPGLRVALHDEFYSSDGTRGCLRQMLDWKNSGSFYGNEPTGRSGTTAETHSLRIDGERIIEQIVGATTFQMPKLLLADWGMEFPRDLPDPEPEIASASPIAATDGGSGGGATLAQRFLHAFGRRDMEALDEVYADDVELYTPLGWPVSGRDALKQFADQFHAANPGMRIALHDEFYSGDGSRACWRIKLHYHNTEAFYGNPATGDQGAMTETHSVSVRDGRITRQVVGDSSFHMPYQELVLWKMDFPTETPDPDPEIVAAESGDAVAGERDRGKR